MLQIKLSFVGCSWKMDEVHYRVGAISELPRAIYIIPNGYGLHVYSENRWKIIRENILSMENSPEKHALIRSRIAPAWHAEFVHDLLSFPESLLRLSKIPQGDLLLQYDDGKGELIEFNYLLCLDDIH